MMNSLLTTILGLDLKDFLLHLFNFLLLVTIVGLLVYKPVIRFVRARKEGIEKQEKEHNEKMEEAEKTKSQYTDLIGSAEHDIAAKKKEAEALAAGESGGDFSGSEAPRGKDFTGGRRRGEKRKGKGDHRHEGRGGGSCRNDRLGHSRQRNHARGKREDHRRLSEGMGRKP